jgi:hypothetical protein
VSGQLIMVNICHLPLSFHFCMKALVTAFYGCSSESINCSLRTQQRQSVSRKIQCWPFSCRNKNTSIAVVLGRGCSSVIIWTLKLAVYCRDCKIFCPVTASWCPIKKHPVKNFPLPPMCVKMFHAHYYVVKVKVKVLPITGHEGPESE